MRQAELCPGLNAVHNFDDRQFTLVDRGTRVPILGGVHQYSSDAETDADHPLLRDVGAPCTSAAERTD